MTNESKTPEEMAKEERRLEMEVCTIRCPRCGRLWQTSFFVEWCNCLYCEMKLDPKKHVVVESENEVN